MERSKLICYVMFPVDFFRRPVVLKMINRWERSIEWLFFLVSMAREAQAGGKLILDGQPVSVEDLSLLHRTSLAPEFIEYIISIGWFTQENGILRLAKPTDWYRPKSKEPEAEAERSADRRAAEKAVADEQRMLTESLSGLHLTAERPQGDRRATEDQPQDDRTETADDRSSTARDRTQYKYNLSKEEAYPKENAACTVLSREGNENKGLEGVHGKPALMVAGVKTISSTANRLAAIVQRCFPTFIPKIQEADTLVLDMIAICKRQSKQWQDNYTEADFELGLDLASRHAEALEQEGRGPHKLLAWIREVNGRKYIDIAHDWRKTNEKRAAKGKEPLSPLEPDLSELERRR